MTTLGYFAGVAITMVLSTVVAIRVEKSFAPDRRSDTTAAVFDAKAVEFHAVFAGFTAVFLSLLSMVLLSTINGHDDIVWRSLICISALIHTDGTYNLLRHHQATPGPSARRVAMLVIGTTVAVVSFATAAGLLASVQSLVLFLGILWLMAVTTVSFLSLFRMTGEP